MTTYPALVQLLRLLGRDQALAALGLDTEPDPDALTDAQREALGALLDAQLEAVAAELAQEAAASDDVTSAGSAHAWLADRVAGYRDLVGDGRARQLLEAAGAAADAWA